MGACMSVEDQAERARSEAIDSQLLDEARKFKKEAKVRLDSFQFLYCNEQMC